MKNIICILIFGIVCLDCVGQTPTLSIYDSLKVMPPFKYYTLDGKAFTMDSLKPGLKTVVIYFNPKCEHCQEEAKLISDSLDDFPNAQFLFVSRADSAMMKQFAVDYKLENNPRITVLIDKDLLYYTFTIASFTPSIHVYDENGHLIYFTQHEMKKELLLRVLK